ncbi:MAG: ATP synthase F0 subunit B [Acidobacteriaceae bacterium]|nr:ATP synthase F0 subunit B [Acidobacteriaceae bacterium]
MATFSKKLMIAAMAVAMFAPVAVAPRAFAQEAAQHATVPSSSPVANVPEKKQEVKDESDEYRHSPMVTKLGAMLGMNVEQAATAFTVFNFLILAIAIGYGLLKMLPKTFRARSSAIQKQLVDARTATEEATSRLNSVEARLAKLDDQIADFREQAKTDSVRDEQRIKQSVEDEKEKILVAAETEIQSATATARREIQKYAAELAVEQAARKLVVTAETDRLLVEAFAHKLGAGKGEAN